MLQWRFASYVHHPLCRLRWPSEVRAPIPL